MFKASSWRLARLALCSGLLWSSVGLAADLAIGDAAPAFALQGSDGKVHHLADYRGQAVVLAWFPKAFTGG